MKFKTLLFFGFLAISISSYSQIDITITLKTTKDVEVAIMQGGNKVTDLKNADFSDGKGKLHVINKTTDLFTVYFVGNKNTLIFNIPSASIPKQNGSTDGLVEYSINSDGSLNPPLQSGILKKGMGIAIKSKDLTPDKPILPSTTSKNRVPKSNEDREEQTNERRIYKYVEREIKKKGYEYIASQNIVIDKNGIIHMYLNENGNPIYSYFPVTAKENYDKFQFHIISLNNADYVVDSEAEFNPVDIVEEVTTNVPAVQSDKSETKIKYNQYNSPIFGPYTTSFPFTITRNLNNVNEVIVDRDIQLLKTKRVSVGTAVVATWLENPENITTFIKPNGETTLIADDKDIRGFLSLFLTFHIVPRNLNIPPRSIKERLGVSVGTNLSDKSFSNFFLGLNVEVTNGLFFNAGGHFGQVNYVVGHDKFDFGNEVFSGTLETRKKWVLGGPYIAVNIDTELFAKVFKNILGPNSN
ncbi:hypothetical protein [Flavobacterium aestivum]|uniref:hypothetical protein n=1 Tax=Flavobacterium aestivum TaxID=3003257 RepID=UPI002482CCCC|nr:hypothetical protein [Flavobacterium aestivum]